MLEAAATRSSRWLARETGSTFGFGMFQMRFVPGLFRQAAALAYAPLGEVIPSDHPARSRWAAPAGRRRRRDRALERGADPVGPLDRGAARARQHRRAEAVGVVADRRRPALGRDLRRGGLPAGVLNIVTHAPGAARPIGDELVENPAVRRINFTGSTAHRPQAGRGSRAATSSASCSSSAATTR